MAIFNSYVKLPEGKSQQFPGAKSLQVLGAGGCGKVFLANKWPLGTGDDRRLRQMRRWDDF
jgi:hypothetical protein